jgi:methylglutaconyl-CoA hydratase
MTTLPAFPVEGILFAGATLRTERLARGVVRLVLDRPGVRNAFDGPMIREFTRALAGLAADDPAQVRLLLLEGEGAVFCAGADLGYMREQAQAPLERNLDNARDLGRMFAALAGFPSPVVAAVRGAAIGGGLGLAVCSDFTLAEAQAVFATSEVTLGLVPAVIGPFVVRRLGLAHAAPLMLTGRRILAPEGLACGLVQRLVGPGEAWEEVLGAVLEAFLAAGPGAARATKALLARIAPLPDAALAEHAAGVIAAARASAEGRAGLDAFLGHGAPPWAAGPDGRR